MSEIFESKNFKSLKDLENHNLNFPGIYALRIKDISILPEQLKNEIKNRETSIIYIGKSDRNISDRLEEECRGKRHGTFFRGIGALIDFRPPKGSLCGKSNSNNYKFSSNDCKKIIDWLNENLLFDYLKVEKNIDYIERDMIKHFQPILNSTHNPNKSKYLKMLRKECRDIALLGTATNRRFKQLPRFQ